MEFTWMLLYLSTYIYAWPNEADADADDCGCSDADVHAELTRRSKAGTIWQERKGWRLR